MYANVDTISVFALLALALSGGIDSRLPLERYSTVVGCRRVNNL